MPPPAAVRAMPLRSAAFLVHMRESLTGMGVFTCSYR